MLFLLYSFVGLSLSESSMSSRSIVAMPIVLLLFSGRHPVFLSPSTPGMSSVLGLLAISEVPSAVVGVY